MFTEFLTSLITYLFSMLLQPPNGKRLSVQEEENRSYVGGLISSFHEVAAIARCTVCVTVCDHKNSLMERDP